MNRTHFVFIIVFTALPLFYPSTVVSEESVSSLLDRLPSNTISEGQTIAAQLFDLGPEGIQEICNRLLSSGAGNDSAARYALHGLSLHALRPGAERERKIVEKADLRALDAATETEVKIFLMEQIQIVGKKESVEPLGKYLTDHRLCEPATRALLEIGDHKAIQQFMAALPQVHGQNRITILTALGKLRAKKARDLIRQNAASSNPEIQQAAFYALANLGDPWIIDSLANSIRDAIGPQKANAASLYLLCARRLAETGKKRQCAEICRDLIKTWDSSWKSSIFSGALNTLVSVEGKKAYPDLLAAVDNPDREVRIAALEKSLSISGQDLAKLWLEKIKQVTPEAQAEIIAMLGRRGDPIARAEITRALDHSDQGVRLSAIEALTLLGDRASWLSLLGSLDRAGDGVEVNAIKNALLRFSDPDLLPTISRALAGSPANAQIALLAILGSRQAKTSVEMIFAQTNNPEQSVRVAAIKALENIASEKDLPRLIDLLLNASSSSEKSTAQSTLLMVCGRIPDENQREGPILAALQNASSEKQVLLLPILPKMGGKRSLNVVLKLIASDDSAIQDASIRALSEWSSVEAAPALLNLSQNAANTLHRILALRGYIRMAGSPDIADRDQLDMFQNAMTLANRLEEKRLILSGLASVKTLESLKLAVSYLDEESLQEETALAAIQIACPQSHEEQGLLDPEASALLKRVKPFLKDENSQNALDRQLNRIAMATGEGTDPSIDRDKGFAPLFNGLNLGGWTGDTSGYTVEEGKIVCLEKGPKNLFTDKEYGNFILRFEFKLSPGANNGLGIRAPLEGNAAYAGMELQILDNTADQYKDLKPYQYHGSIYGVVPAKRGYLKPVGQWNFQEVIAHGPRITVKLNGTTIVDGDIAQASRNGTIDGNDHPGLLRESGHIGFLGHGSRVEFRNLRIKELPHLAEPPEVNRLSEIERQEGFKLIFDGLTLQGWKIHEGLPDGIGGKWFVEEGTLVGIQDPPGKGGFLTTLDSYQDFELRLQTKIDWPFDSGIFLRVGPQGKSHQVTLDYRPGGEVGGIYCPWTQGFVAHCTEGMYYFKKDDWNDLRIRCQGEPARIQVWLNEVLLTDFQHTTETTQGVPKSGTLCLQVHPGGKDFDKGRALFRSIRIKPLPRTSE